MFCLLKRLVGQIQYCVAWSHVFLEHCVDPNEMLRKRYVHLMLSPRDESCCICSDLIVDVTRCYSRDVLNVICGRLGRYSVSSS